MPIKILNEGLQKLNADSIKKSEIIELMDRYHNNTGKVKQGQGKYNDHKKDEHTTSAWFSLKEIIDFLVINNINLAPGADLSKYGIRIYFGMHHKDNSFQPKPYRSTTPMSKFEHKDTLILVATENKGPNNDEDMLTETNFISMASYNPEEGLDNARLCPPECNGGM